MPVVTLKDLSLKDYGLTPRIVEFKKAYFRAMPEICIERARLITRYSRVNGLFNQQRISVLDKARLYKYVLSNRQPIVHHSRAFESAKIPFVFKDRSLFAGSTTSRFKGVPLYPEFLALTLWQELWSISTRSRNPYHIMESEVEELNGEIFPHWIENTILELARKRSYEENERKVGIKKHAPEMKLLDRLVFFLATKPNCISHTIPDFSRAIRSGLRHLINEALQKATETTDSLRVQFYTAVSEVLEGMITYSHHIADEALKLADLTDDSDLKKELGEISSIHRRVPEFPAGTFREGLTTLWMCWTAIHLENPNVGLSLGRLDQVLYDLYRKDIEEGIIDVQDAIELICNLWLKIGDHVPTVPDAGEQLFGGTGSNQAITIGGIDVNGNDAVNDLTYVMLRATELMKLRDPNLNARYFAGVNSPSYLRRLCEVNVNTGATPAIHNDKAVIQALTHKGDSLAHARDYGITGCVEPGSNGRFYGHTGAILFNLTSVLDLTLFNGRHRHTGLDVVISRETGDPRTFRAFEEFKDAFATQTRWMMEQTVSLNNVLGRIHQDYYPTPILSAFFEGPMDKGRDLIHGGAKINSSGATVIGLADVADSLSAIQRVVFDEKAISFAGLLDALNNDFKGYEALQARLTNPEKTPKFGNEDPDADSNVTWILQLLDNAFGEKENYRGGRYRVGYWTMTNHAGFGRFMGALPNGRKAHENFTSGITPVSGVTPYLTQTLNSVAGQPAQFLSSGIALNLKYTPEIGDKQRMLDNFAASVEGYFDDLNGSRDGGMEIQFNITSHDTFVDAVQNPQKYPELLVRVSGYTAYFKDLNPQMQKEIIDRTEYLLSTKRMIRFDPFHLPPRGGER
ncbi:MAG: pyruvate formate lyase family protein [Pseudomonadota bacterium]